MPSKQVLIELKSKQINNLVKNFNLEIEELKDLLYSTKSFIAGGSVLSTFLNEKLDDNQDLDIFLPIPYTKEETNNFSKYYEKFKLGFLPYEELAKNKIASILTSKNYQLQRQVPKDFTNENKPTKDIEYMKCGLTHFIKNIENYENKNINRKIQIITVYDHSIQDILNTFDLNICQIAILNNGFNFHFYIGQSYENLELIENKKMYILNPLYPANLHKRIKKYLLRGFTWIRPNREVIYNIDNNQITDLDIACYLSINFPIDQIITYEQFIQINKEKEEKEKQTFSITSNFEDFEEDEQPKSKQNFNKVYFKKSIQCSWCELKITNGYECVKCNSILCENCKFGDDVIPGGIICCNSAEHLPEFIYSEQDIAKGVEYMEDKNYISYCINYQFLKNDDNNKQIMCLDEFYLLDNTTTNIDANLNIKHDLEVLIHSGSCYGLAKYIYQLIHYIKLNKEKYIKDDEHNQPNTNCIQVNKEDLKQLLDMISKFQEKYKKFIS